MRWTCSISSSSRTPAISAESTSISGSSLPVPKMQGPGTAAAGSGPGSYQIPLWSRNQDWELTGDSPRAGCFRSYVPSPFISREPLVVPQFGIENNGEQRFLDRWVGDREEHLHAPVEVTGHEISAPEQHVILSVVPEVVDPCVLQKASDNCADRDVLACARDARRRQQMPRTWRSTLTPA